MTGILSRRSGVLSQELLPGRGAGHLLRVAHDQASRADRSQLGHPYLHDRPVAPGGAVITEFKLHVPGNYTIVDHALARMERGLAGLLIVEGAPNPDIYNGMVMPGMGH